MRRTMIRVLAVLAAMVLAVSGLAFPASTAQAASGDRIPAWSTTVTVNRDGSAHVVEKITYQFANPSGSHGFKRGLVTREKYAKDDNKDRVVTYSNIQVEASDGASSRFSTATAQASGGRHQELTLKIGDPNRYVQRRQVTYTISYDVSGGILTSDKGDEFTYDVVPADTHRVDEVSATVTMPTEITKVVCSAAASGSKGTCPEAEAQGTKAIFSSRGMGDGKTMTIGVAVPPNTLQNNQPVLVDAADAAEKKSWFVSLIGAGITSLVSLLGGMMWWRRNGRDERFLGVPPGLTPAPGDEGTVGRDTKPQIPVQFSPPPISVGEAGMLVDGRADVRDTTATMIDLAVRGALRLNVDADQSYLSVTLMDPSLAQAHHEQVLLQELFGGADVGTTTELGMRGVMTGAHESVASSLRQTLKARGWYKRMPNALTSGFAGLPMVLLGVFFFLPSLGASLLTSGVLRLLLVLAPIGVAFMVIGALMASGRRSATGRAMADQVEGFRTYLTTAEAEQLKFEEGEDIFSRYLPWAIMFGVAERWTKVCARLVELGRIPEYQPSWYYGPWHGYMYFPTSYINDGLTTSSMPEIKTDSSSGSGGSMFDGGFSSGGGFGGGSADSW